MGLSLDNFSELLKVIIEKVPWQWGLSLLLVVAILHYGSKMWPEWLRHRREKLDLEHKWAHKSRELDRSIERARARARKTSAGKPTTASKPATREGKKK